MRRSLILAVLLLLPLGVQGQEIQLAENSTKEEFDQAVAVDLYDWILRQMAGHRLEVASRPSVWLHLLPKKQVEATLSECVRGGCGHVIRLSAVKGKSQRMVFLGISPARVDVWMDSVHDRLLAQAIATSLDYENRLYLDPDRLDEIAFTAWTISRSERTAKVSVQALRAGR